jgi:hypothetical protein
MGGQRRAAGNVIVVIDNDKAAIDAISNGSQSGCCATQPINMKTSSFLAALRAQSHLPLVFRAARTVVSPGYHLTEVKRVAYETMDCGAMTHRWAESQFEIWVPEIEKLVPGRGHMPAEKFLRIIDRVEAELPLNGEATARIHASFNGQPAALYDIEAINAREGQLWIELTPDRTRCKAAERRGGSLTACCSGGSEETEHAAAGAGCGCGTAEPAKAAACCA